MEVKCYSGHIRNWKSLCKELKINSSLSREDREKEIILKGYRKWGKKIGNHIYGMFAFAIVSDNSIFCIRDHFGTKPFYYYVTDNNELLFGNRISDFINDSRFKKEFNYDMLQIYLSLSYVGGENTFFKGVKKLMPGCYLTFSNNKLKIKSYWEPEFNPDDSKSIDEYANLLHKTLKKIMKEVKDDNEVAESFLSSGVDSSYVLAMSDAKIANTSGYVEEGFDESELASKTAKMLKRDIKVTKVCPDDYFSYVPYVMKHMEQPLGDASAIVFAIACKNISSRTKLCYSGEGADEFFGGYNIYKKANTYGENLENFFVGNTNILNENDKKKLLKKYDENVLPINLTTNLYKKAKKFSYLSKMQYIDINIWLDGDIYLNVDKMSSCCGLEIRMPFTDLRIFDIASKLPDDYKLNDEQNKLVLRKSAARVLTEEIAYRKKIGFAVPIRFWLTKKEYNKSVFDLLKSNISKKFFNSTEINRIIDDFLKGDTNLWRVIWTIYVFLVWYKIYFDD